ncbi:MAG: hypothetical protein KKC11_03690 [Candidatus Omnitrophica bacterium]|nr:hypothetical protein [Candidatus Omnitrophota bacterium]MBU1134750.1 hypothetical protein [Candidatus Omnitrophota bacterium]
MKKLEDKNAFQKEIQHLMETYNLSEEDIAAKLQIRAQSVYRWQRGLSRPKSRIVLQAFEEFKKGLPRKDVGNV